MTRGRRINTAPATRGLLLQMRDVRAEETEQSDDDQVDGNDIVQHAWHNQDENPGDKRYKWTDTHGDVHFCSPCWFSNGRKLLRLSPLGKWPECVVLGTKVARVACLAHSTLFSVLSTTGSVLGGAQVPHGKLQLRSGRERRGTGRLETGG